VLKDGKKIGEAKENSWLGVVDAWSQMSSKAVAYENIILQVSFRIAKTDPNHPI